MNEDLNRARALLEQGKYTCVLCIGTQTKVSTARGVRSLIDLLRDGQSAGFSAADKVVGKATAFLYVLLGVRAVYARVASEAAIRVLNAYGIEIHCDTRVPAILNRTQIEFCPMESAVRDIEDPQQALIAIEEALRRLMQH